MKNWTVYVTTAFIALVISLMIGAITDVPPKANMAETVYARVVRTGTLRCAYQVWPPFVAKDPSTQKFSGIFPDIIEAVAKQANLKLEWVEEVGTASPYEGFKTGRYDLICSPFTPTPARAVAADFSVPVTYVPYYLFARVDDNRFDSAYAAANNPAVKFVTNDGDLSETIIKKNFPKAGIMNLPNLTNASDMLQNVALKKADLVITEASIAYGYMKNNPGKIKQVMGDPVATPPAAFPLPPDQYALAAMINTSLQSLRDTGELNSILQHYEQYPGTFLRPAKPYTTP